MKILHLITDLDTGGAEVMLHQLLSHLDRRFESTVVSLVPGGAIRERIEALGIPVRSIHMAPGLPTPAAAMRLVQTVRELQPDLIHGWMFHGCLAAHWAAAFQPTPPPVIWGLHHGIQALSSENRLTATLIRMAALVSSAPACIVYVSKASARQHEAIGYDRRKTVIVPNGFNATRFRPDPHAYQTVRQEFELPPDTPLVGLIGRYHPVKDHHNFLEAARQIAERTPAHFLMAGKGIVRDNPELMGLVQSLGLCDRVHLLGERRDMPRLIAALDVASSSSLSEAFPIVIGEAMACEVPCVVTDVGDSAWLVGDTGKSVPRRSPTALAEAIVQLLGMSAGDRHELGRLARQRILDHFTIETVARRYENLYGDFGQVGSVSGHKQDNDKKPTNYSNCL